MQCTRSLLAAPGFWKRTLDEMRRATDTAVHLRGISAPTQPRHLITFDTPESLDLCKTMSDGDIGGFSKVSLTHHPAVYNTPTSHSTNQPSISSTITSASAVAPAPAPAPAPAHALFSGHISLDLPAHRPDVQRSGYAAFRTRDLRRTLFGRTYINLDTYRYLALRVLSDGRKYFLNLQTESIVPTDLHQHRLHARTPGRWETVVLGIDEFVRTNYGMPVEPVREMLRDKVTSCGVGLTDRVPGAFELRIADVWATNSADGGVEPGSELDLDEFGRAKERDGHVKSMM